MIISSKLAHPALKYCRDHRRKPLLTNLASQNVNLTFSMTMYRQCERHSQMRNFPWTIGSKNWKICIFVVDYLVAATNMGLPTWNLGIFIIIFWHLTLTAKAGACVYLIALHEIARSCFPAIFVMAIVAILTISRADCRIWICSNEYHTWGLVSVEHIARYILCLQSTSRSGCSR